VNLTSTLEFSRVHPAVLTPFGEDGELRVDALADSLDWLIDSGVDGIVGLGTLGEFRALDGAERRSVLTTIIDSTAGRVPGTIGVSAETAEDAADLAAEATRAGAQALMCLPPLIYHAADSEIVAFFDQVSAASDLPLMLYNNPSGSRNDLSPEVIARLFELETALWGRPLSHETASIEA
jgi:dihydrodipicolinate synthase/N-acetylneuraminate lyase